MDNRIDFFIESLNGLLRGRVNKEVLDELVAEVRSHYDAARELFAEDDDPGRSAIELLGTPEAIAASYLRENPRIRPAALFTALTVGAFFFAQPIFYYVNEKADYLITSPVVWINASLCFFLAAVWCRQLIAVPLAGCILLLTILTTVWASPRYVGVPSLASHQGTPALNWVLAPREEVARFVTWGQQISLEERRRIRSILEEGAASFSRASEEAQVHEQYVMGGKLVLPRLYSLRFEENHSGQFASQLATTSDFGNAKLHWRNWEEEIWPTISAGYAEIDRIYETMRERLRNWVEGSVLPVGGAALAWGLLALTYLLGLNWLAVKISGRIPIRPGRRMGRA